MRKRIGTGLLAFLMMATLLAVPALAASPPNTETDPGVYDLAVTDTAKYTVTPMTAENVAADVKNTPTAEDKFYPKSVKLAVTVQATAGEYDLIFARSGKETDGPNKDNLVYIDQKTVAAGADSVSFDVYPSALKADTTYYIFLSTSSAAQTKVAEFKYYLPYILGDVDNDKAVNATDALWVLQNAAGTRTFDSVQMLAGDVDKDGAVNATDALWILQSAAGTRELS